MRLYFARHGESEANRLGVFSNRGFKHGLTSRGREQALALAQRLTAGSVTHVLTSPLKRAVETAAIVAGRLGLGYQVAPELAEYDCGVLEGRADEDAWDLYTEVVRAWVEEGDHDRRIPAGESWHDMHRRFVPFVEQLVDGVDGAAVLIGHGGLYRLMLPRLLTNVDQAYALERGIGNGGYVVAERCAGGLACLEWDGEALPMADS